MDLSGAYKKAQRLQAEVREALDAMTRIPMSSYVEQPASGGGSGAIHTAPGGGNSLGGAGNSLLTHRFASTHQAGDAFSREENRAKNLLREIEALERALVVDPADPDPKMAVWRARATQINQETSALWKAVDHVVMKRRAERDEMYAREELLGGRGGGAAGGGGAGQGGGDSVQIAIGDGDSLSRSKMAAESILNQGAEIARQIAEQNSVLRGMQEKMLDMAGTLGVSTALMRVIERRQTVDRIILWGGMALITLFVFAFYIWVRYG